jgi:hypothetical protein
LLLLLWSEDLASVLGVEVDVDADVLVALVDDDVGTVSYCDGRGTGAGAALVADALEEVFCFGADEVDEEEAGETTVVVVVVVVVVVDSYFGKKNV